MELTVYNIEGNKTRRTVELDDAVFGVETPNDHAIYQDVRLILANRRQGTHKSKERAEVSGSNKKPYRQKGTGNARPGHKRSPLWRHGGRVFGPKPRDYGFKLNKKTRSIARCSALTYKAREEKVLIVESFAFEAPKTSQLLGILAKLELEQAKVLLVLGEGDNNIYLSGRNLPKTEILTADSLNTYDILNADTMIVTEDAVEMINQRLAN